MEETEIPQVTPEEAETPVNVVKFSDIQNIELIPGMVIEEIPSIEGFDGIASKLSQGLAEEAETDPRAKPTGEPIRIHDKLESDNSKIRFFGKTANYRAVIIPPNLSLVEKRKTRLSPIQAATFLAIRDCFSSGRGNIGTLTTECTIYLVKNIDMRADWHYYATNLIIRIVSNPMERLLEESQINWTGNVREALTHVYSGGLPSLGKRR